MASVLGDTTCSLHPDRQSTARCPTCRQFYCAECITEHDGRLTCASCLRSRSESSENGKMERRWVIAPFVQFALALLLVWVLFYLFGETLGDVPDDFHDGTIWE